MAQRDEVANAVVFLASDLSSVTTGAVLQPAVPVEPSQEFTQAPLGVCKWSCGISSTATNCVR
jgi:hypothetical protein